MFEENIAAGLNRITLAGNIPLNAQLELTYGCPRRCFHCYLPQTGGRAPASPDRELTTAEWSAALESLKSLGCMFITLTGGEPLLRADLPEICRRATSLGFDIRIFTSGWGVTAGLIAELRGLNISRFELSFYGRPAAHDAVTGVKGSQAETLAAARLLKNSGYAVKFKTPLMKATAGELRYIAGLAEREGFLRSFDPVLTLASDGEMGNLRRRLPAGELKALLADPVVNPVPPGCPGQPDPAGPVCGAGRNTVNINPYGDVFPCLQLGVKLGSIRRLPLAGIWNNSPWLRKWRKVTVSDIKACRGCARAAFCSRCPGISLLETGDINEPYGAACLIAGV